MDRHNFEIKAEKNEDILMWEHWVENGTSESTSGIEGKSEFIYKVKEEISDDEEIKKCAPNDVENKLVAIKVKAEIITEPKIEISDEYYFPINSPQCVTCEMKFFKDEELNEHYQFNESHKPKRYKCLECLKTFDFLCQLRDHKTATHSEGVSKLTKLFKCNICEKDFCHPLSLQEHSMVHTGEKPFACSECGQKFFTNYTLASHQVRHKDLKAIMPRVRRSRKRRTGDENPYSDLKKVTSSMPNSTKIE